MIAPLKTSFARQVEEWRGEGIEDIAGLLDLYLDMKPERLGPYEKGLSEILAAYLSAGLDRSEPTVFASVQAAQAKVRRLMLDQAQPAASVH